MNYILISGLVILALAIIVGFRLGWELLQQNGRMLLRIEELEKRLTEKTESDNDRSLSPDGGEEGAPLSEEESQQREMRFAGRSLANSKLKRDGLKTGTPAPEFRLPRLDGGELSLSELRGRLVLLVFSSPHCGPCNALAPRLEKFHRKHPELEMVMISKGSPDDNRAKIAEYGLTFPVVLQKQWEVSRAYAFFATPVAYLIDGSGVITADVAVGVDGVVELMTRARRILREEARKHGTSALKRLAGWQVKTVSAWLQKTPRGAGGNRPVNN